MKSEQVEYIVSHYINYRRLENSNPKSKEVHTILDFKLRLSEPSVRVFIIPFDFVNINTWLKKRCIIKSVPTNPIYKNKRVTKKALLNRVKVV